MGSVIEVRVLGPVELMIDDRQVELGGGHERALIGYLALHPGKPVATDEIVEALWGERPPPTAPEMVRTYVARARKRLGERLQRRPGGYVLEIPHDSVDAFRFERLYQDGLRRREAGEYARASETLRQALDLWRDMPLPELQFQPGGSAEAARLEELRLSAIEARAGVELSLGRAGELVSELEGLVRKYPYRERLRRDLMLALYRCGRQTDALERYLEGRRLLVEEVGIEPSRELQELQAAILRQDPALDLPRAAAPSPGLIEPPARRARGPRRRQAVIAALCALAVGAGVAGAVVAEPPARQQTLGRDAVGAIDPASGAVTFARTITGAPGPIALGASTIWVAARDQREVLALSLNTLRVRGSARLATFPEQLATNGSTAWVGDGFDGTLIRVDHSGGTGASFRPEPRSTGRLALAYGAGSLWVGSQDGALTELAGSTDRALAVIHGIGKPEALVVKAGTVWIAEATSNRLLRVSAGRHRVIGSVPIGGPATDLVAGGGSVWALTPDQRRVWRVDVRTGAVSASITVGPDPSSMAFINGEVWVASPLGTVQQVDPAEDEVARTVHFDGPIGGIAVGHGRLWVSVR